MKRGVSVHGFSPPFILITCTQTEKKDIVEKIRIDVASERKEQINVLLSKQRSFCILRRFRCGRKAASRGRYLNATEDQQEKL